MANVNDQIDAVEAQRVMQAEIARISQNTRLLTMATPEEDPELQGDPMPYSDVVKIVSPYFVKDTLFNTTGQRKIRGLKASRIQHVGLARVLLQRFIEIEKSMPNNMEFAMYFVQMVYVEKVLHMRVDWNALPSNVGIGKGRPVDKKRAREAGQQISRTKPPLVTPTDTQHVAELETELAEWKWRAETAEFKLQQYVDKYGTLSNDEIDVTMSGLFGDEVTAPPRNDMATQASSEQSEP